MHGYFQCQLQFMAYENKSRRTAKGNSKKVSLCSGIKMITIHTLYIANHFEISSICLVQRGCAALLQLAVCALAGQS